MVMDSKHIDSVIPEGLAGSILSELSILRMDESVGYLIREKTIEIIKSLEKARSNNFTNTPFTLLGTHSSNLKFIRFDFNQLTRHQMVEEDLVKVSY